MRCLESLWSVFQLSRLCCTTASTSSMSLSLLIVVTKAGTRSMYSLVLPPPVVRALRRAIYWVGFMFVSLRVCGFEAIAFQNRFPTVPLCVVCVCFTRFREFSVVLEKRPTGIRCHLQTTLQLSLHIQHCGQQCSCALGWARTLPVGK